MDCPLPFEESESQPQQLQSLVFEFEAHHGCRRCAQQAVRQRVLDLFRRPLAEKRLHIDLEVFVFARESASLSAGAETIILKFRQRGRTPTAN